MNCVCWDYYLGIIIFLSSIIVQMLINLGLTKIVQIQVCFRF
jgi:hypothetical protein